MGSEIYKQAGPLDLRILLGKQITNAEFVWICAAASFVFELNLYTCRAAGA
jgi:hypothetical protein